MKTNGYENTKPNEKEKENENVKEKEKERECMSAAGAASRARTLPTLGEVEEYCRERGNQVNAQRFMDFYTANG